MNKIKLRADSFDSEMLRNFFQQISQPMRPVPGLEVEHLVLLEYNRKHYLKIQFEREYNLNLLPYQAICLHRMLTRIGLQDQLAQTVRDGICHELHRQLTAYQLQTPTAQISN